MGKSEKEMGVSVFQLLSIKFQTKYWQFVKPFLPN